MINNQSYTLLFFTILLLACPDKAVAEFQLEPIGSIKSLVSNIPDHHLANPQAIKQPLKLMDSPQAVALQKQMSANRAKRQELLGKIDSSNVIIANTRIRMESNRRNKQAELSQLDRQIDQTKAKIIQAKQSLASDQKILSNIRPAAAQGAISQVQVEHQEQRVKKGIAELETLTQELERLQSEQQRLLASSKSDLQAQKVRIAEQQQVIKQHRLDIAQLEREYQILRRARLK
jgi:chromosome segregation ATPase